MALELNNLKLQALRGAITSTSNSPEAIESAVNELTAELVQRNKLCPQDIISIVFSVTIDLNSCFPASIARRKEGWENIALLDCQQMHVKGDLKNCIRILAHVWLPNDQKPQHPYLREATVLRPDR